MSHSEKCPQSIQPRHSILRSIVSKLAWLAGPLAVLWLLARVLPKPTRATYPCVRAATPVAVGFVTYLTSAGMVGLLVHKAARWLKNARYVLAGTATLVAVGASLYGTSLASRDAAADNVPAFVATDAPNTPIGQAKGIRPGRVAWARDPTAAHFAGTGRYTDDANTDKVKVRAILEQTILSVGDQTTIAAAWDAIIRYHNTNVNGTNAGYTAGEKVALKINLNNNGSNTMIDATPQMVHAVLWELVNVVKVAQADISIYDTMRRSAMGLVKTECQGDFPNVHYNDGGTVAGLTYSGGGIGTGTVGTEAVNAKYLVNLAVLKRHGEPSPNWVDAMGNTGVSLTFKNHCGTTNCCSCLHFELRDWNQPFGSYNPLVDLMASQKIGNKTILFIIDGLYSGNLWNAPPTKWTLAPFNGNYPSSVFASLDPVAIDSVGLDFLHAQWDLLSNADNYLHEAAKIGAPQSGTVYKPDGTAVTGSLGVHEHWNNSTLKQYTRNLDPVNGKGIELVQLSNSGTGGTPGTGGASSTGGSNTGGSAAQGGTSNRAGASSTGGVVVAAGGSNVAGIAATGGLIAASSVGGTSAGTTNSDTTNNTGSCSCRVGARTSATSIWALAMLSGLALRRRRATPF